MDQKMTYFAYFIAILMFIAAISKILSIFVYTFETQAQDTSHADIVNIKNADE